MSQAERTPKKKTTFWYCVARVLAFIVLNTICPTHYHGKERLNADAPYIVIANHSSWMDPVVMAKPIRRYDVTFLGKKELMKNKLAGAILRNMHCIGVERHNTDMAAMRACLNTLRQGGVLGIFPEGTRHHKGLMDEMEGGVAMIALRSGAPLIPMLITPKVRLFHRTDCYVGEPIPTEDLRAQVANKETCDALLRRITDVYARMAAESTGKSD